MNSRVVLAVNGVDLGVAGEEVADDVGVAGQYGEDERSVALVILSVDKAGLEVQQLVTAGRALVLSTVMQSCLPSPVSLSHQARLPPQYRPHVVLQPLLAGRHQHSYPFIVPLLAPRHLLSFINVDGEKF